MKEEMSNLKEAQALTQAGLKTEKVNRLTQIRNIKRQDSMPEATQMIQTQEEDSYDLNPDTEMIDDALAQIVPSSEELVDYLDAKLIRFGGCLNYRDVKHEYFTANFWTVESCAEKASNYSWAKYILIGDDKTTCQPYAAGCTHDGAPYRYYELKNQDDSIAFRQPQFTRDGGCANHKSIKRTILNGSNWTVAECSDACKTYDWCKEFFISNAKTQCMPFAAGCTQDNAAFKLYTYPDSYAQSIAPGNAKFMWHGGCKGSAQSKLISGNWNIDTCLAKTKSFTWATGFFINDAKTECLPYGEGCTHNKSGGYNYYKITTENSPATIGELSSLTKRVEELMNAASPDSKTDFTKVQKEIQEVDD